MKSKKFAKQNIDLETLKFWKYSSTKSTLTWLQDAIEFSNAARKNKKN